MMMVMLVVVVDEFVKDVIKPALDYTNIMEISLQRINRGCRDGAYPIALWKL